MLCDGKIGIFGGTFDPVHNGHIRLALKAADELSLKKIYVMPGGNPPHKVGRPCVDVAHRCNMVKLAIKDFPCLEFSDYEAVKTGLTYSAVTLTELSKLYGDIYFMIGADSFFGLESWYHPEIVMRCATMVVANRGKIPQTKLEMHADRLKRKYDARISFIHMEDVPVSSSGIRRRISAGEDVSGMLDPDVLRYILDNGLYK